MSLKHSGNKLNYFGLIAGFVEKQLAWLPYATIALLIFIDVRLARLLEVTEFPDFLFKHEGPFLAIGLFFVLQLLLIHLSLCVRKKTRLKACFSLVLAMILISGFLLVVENLFPPTYRFTDLQRSLQAQIGRRVTNNEKLFCGVNTRLDANYFGWIDRERSYQSNQPRILFIGDSFLETLTTKPLARRVEERLASTEVPIEVINLSKDDTEPETEYRHRFYELAFEYAPKHIFMFIYSGNDLSTHFKYLPYSHPLFRITPETIDFLSRTNVDDRLLNRLQEMKLSGKIFGGKSSFTEDLQTFPVDLKEINLAYLAAIAYSHGHGPSFSERFFPNTIVRFWNLRDKISDFTKSMKPSKRRESGHCARVPFDTIQEKYETIFALPREQRLEAIARFIANTYCQVDDHQPFFDVLKDQDPWFINQIIEQPDAAGSLLNTVVVAANNENRKKEIKMHQVKAASTEYVKLFHEFNQAANAQGVGFTLVFIPVATNIDDDYLLCWERLRGVGKGDGRGPPMVSAIKNKLGDDIPFIDLTDFPAECKGGYWIFDGHWNEKGNDAVAKILAEYIGGMELKSGQ